MPLITQRTNFKNLKFGKDRPGGGSSNQPYITKDIPSGDPSNIFNTGGPDFLLRGGLMAPLKAANDVSRLTQMFFDLKSPNGLLFTAKQNILSRTSVETEATEGPSYGGKAVNQGIYLPTSTIAQSAAGFTGTHLNLLGLDPSSPMTGVVGGGIFPSLGLNRYEDKAEINNRGEGSPNNRLVKLTTSSNPFILEYSGGPGAVLGIGKTQIPFSSQRTGENNPQTTSNPEYFYTGSRYSERTKDSWISPIIKGASSKYQEFGGSNLLEFDGKSVISSDGGYTFELAGYNKTTKVDSLEPKSDLSTYQAERYSERTKDSWISPIIKGASSKYQEFGGSNLLEFDGKSVVSSDGGYTFELTEYNKTTKVDSLEPKSDLNTYQVGNKTTLTLDGEQQGGVRINYDNVISSKGVSNIYNSLISGSSPSSILETTYNSNNGFNVYTLNSFPKVTPLHSLYRSKTWNQVQISNATLFSNEHYDDFRRKLIGSPESPDVQESNIMSLAPNYKTKNIEKRVNLGDPGKRKNVLKYSTSTEVLDKITAKEIYSGTNPNHLGTQNDLVKFSIGIVNNDDSSTSNYINFRAFIDSFQDQYTADWGEVQYLGRADKFYNYKGFGRDINLSWTIPAQSKAELIPMYKKLNYLASSLAPSYSEGGFMQGNLARLTFGGYLYNQLGIIRSITYDVPTESSWEIGIDEKGGFDHTVKELPMMIKVTGFKFTPIHEFVPEKSLINPTQNKRYIALSTNSNNNYDN